MKAKNRIALYKSLDFESFINSPNVRAFLGQHYEHYKQLWTADYHKRGNIMKIGSSLHINWLALLAGPAVWYSYHKMWGIVAIFAAIYCAATIYEYYAGISLSTAFVGGNIAIALMTKGQYCHQVIDFMEKNKDLSQAALEEKIARHGGSSVPATIIGTILVFGGIGLCTYIGENLFGPIEDAAPQKQ